MAIDISDTWFEYAFKGLVAVVGAVGIYLWNGLVKSVNAIDSKVMKNKDDLAEQKIYVMQNYATKADMATARVETNATLTRIHDRIDGIYDLLKKP